MKKQINKLKKGDSVKINLEAYEFATQNPNKILVNLVSDTKYSYNQLLSVNQNYTGLVIDVKESTAKVFYEQTNTTIDIATRFLITL